MTTRSKLLLAALWLVWSLALWSQTVNLPFFDEWFFLPDLDNYVHGKSSLLDTVLRPHCEHRMIASKIFLCLVGPAIDFDLRLVCATSLAVLGATSVLLIRTLRLGLLPAFAGLALLLSLTAWENLVWAWQLQVFLAIGLGACGMAWELRAKNIGSLTVAMALLVTSGLSYAAGFGFAAATAVSCWLRRKPTRGIGILAAAIVAMTVHWLTLPKKAIQTGTVDWSDWSRIGEFLLSYVTMPIGGPFLGIVVRIAEVGVLAGILCFGMIRLVRRPAEKRLAFAVGLCLAGLAAGCAIAFGRATSGDTGSTSRYATFAVISWIGIVGVVSTLPVTKWTRVAIWAIALAAIGASLESSGDLIHRARFLARSRAALFSGTQVSFSLLRGNTSDVQVVTNGLEILRRNAWCEVSTPREPEGSARLVVRFDADSCNLDATGVPPGNVLQLLGHVGDQEIVLKTGVADKQGRGRLVLPEQQARIADRFVLRWVDEHIAMRSLEGVVDGR
ncbi:MAG: hypothetical protein KDC95_14700 [Planctomycetes bacterium]|nr:hypothetical protein [Planctomycetota bacterium]